MTDQTAEGVGSQKERVKSWTPLLMVSAFDAFEQHVDETARFVGMSIPVRNWKKVMGKTVIDMDTTPQQVISDKWDKETVEYIESTINSLQGGDRSDADTVSSAADKIFSNYVSATFGANPSIVLKQAGSIPLAAAYLDAKYIPRGKKIRKIDRDLIGKYTKELAWRTMGYATPETKQLKENPNWSQSNKTFQFFFGGGAITKMDAWAASTLWPWAENKIRAEHPELKLGTAEQISRGESEFYKKVAEEFNNALARSQSTSDIMHQGSLRRSKKTTTRALTMFKSDSAQTYNAIRQKIGEAQYYARTGATEQALRTAKKAAGAAFCAMLLNAAGSEVVNFLMALWKHKDKRYRDDEGELSVESVAGEMINGTIGSMLGTVIGGEEFYEFIGNVITDEKWYGIDTPGMKQIEDIGDGIFEVFGGLMELISGGVDILKNDGDLGQFFDDHAGEIMGYIKKGAADVATYLYGLPVNNLEAYLLGTVKTLSPKLASAYEGLISDIGKNDLSNLKGEMLESKVRMILNKRDLTESDETAKALANLYQDGHRGAVPSDIPASVSVNGENRKLGEYQKQAYGNVWGSVVADGLDELVASDAFLTATPDVQEKMLARLYDYAAEQAKSVLFDDYKVSDSTAKDSEIVASGATVAECVIWNTMTGKRREIPAMKSAEKAEWLAEWDLPEIAKETIFRNKITDSKEEAIGELRKAGLTFDQFLKIYAMHGQISGMDLKAGMKAVEFSHWVDNQGYSPEQAALIKDEMAYFSMMPASSGKYDELVAAGMDANEAYELNGVLEDLEPEDGKEQISDLQKWRASVNFSDDVEDQLTALSIVMNDSQIQKVEIAHSYGISPDSYVTLQEIKPRYDADGNGAYKQAEITAAVDALPGRYTTQQKAVLWQLATGSNSAKNNPYDRKVGQQVIDTRKAAKENRQETEPNDQDDFSQAVLNQLLGRG